MRTTLALDDDLIAKAQAFTGLKEKSGLVREALKALTESQKRGMVLFGLRLKDDDPFKVDTGLLKKANCTACHAGANFTDEQMDCLRRMRDCIAAKGRIDRDRLIAEDLLRLAYRAFGERLWTLMEELNSALTA